MSGGETGEQLLANPIAVGMQGFLGQTGRFQCLSDQHPVTPDVSLELGPVLTEPPLFPFQVTEPFNLSHLLRF